MQTIDAILSAGNLTQLRRADKTDFGESERISPFLLGGYHSFFLGGAVYFFRFASDIYYK